MTTVYCGATRDSDTLQKVWKHQVRPVLEKELRHDEERRDRIVNSFEQLFPASTDNEEPTNADAMANAET